MSSSAPQAFYTSYIFIFITVFTIGGTADGAACTFPFTYKQTVYTGCITRDTDRLWCSTTSDYTEQWGYCLGMLEYLFC